MCRVVVLEGFVYIIYIYFYMYIYAAVLVRRAWEITGILVLDRGLVVVGCGMWME